MRRDDVYGMPFESKRCAAWIRHLRAWLWASLVDRLCVGGVAIDKHARACWGVCEA